MVPRPLCAKLRRSSPANLILALFIGGCAARLSEAQRTAIAVQHVWYDELGAKGPPPEIRWEDNLNFEDQDWGGLFFPGWRIYVARASKISDSPFSHEMVHAWLWSEEAHRRDHFHEDATVWKKVEMLNSGLKKEGL